MSENPIKYVIDCTSARKPMPFPMVVYEKEGEWDMNKGDNVILRIPQISVTGKSLGKVELKRQVPDDMVIKRLIVVQQERGNLDLYFGGISN